MLDQVVCRAFAMEIVTSAVCEDGTAESFRNTSSVKTRVEEMKVNWSLYWQSYILRQHLKVVESGSSTCLDFGIADTLFGSTFRSGRCL